MQCFQQGTAEMEAPNQRSIVLSGVGTVFDPEPDCSLLPKRSLWAVLPYLSEGSVSGAYR